ncbi:hypothetical protein ACFFGH_27800 [Lysobacter korlensis]|uniref:Transposase n=1 Tax=Lysobacter korlensis TaxID=553636 RepID=A0ABV6RXF0_9GAMM
MEDELPAPRTERPPHDFESFTSYAAVMTEVVRERLGRLVELALPSGARWHPTGFLILQLLEIRSFGLVRLHIWPARVRVAKPGHPMIHCHGFHLYSTVVAGTYSEVRYDVARIAAASVAEPRALHGFKVEPPRPDNVDRLCEEPDWRYSVRQNGRRTRDELGSVHTQEAGTYHSTAIPMWSTCVTLAITGTHVQGQEDHLVGRPGSFTIDGGRPYVPPDRATLLLRGAGFAR